MFSKDWQRAAGAALAGIGLAVAITACAGTGPAGVSPASATGSASVSSAEPWKSAGPGWVLALVSASTQAKPAPGTLYLVSPAGQKYAVHTFSAATMGGQQPALIAWSGDKTRALFRLNSTPAKAEQLNLLTGKASGVTLADGASPLEYSLPSGQRILAATRGDTATLGEYSPAGQLMTPLGSRKYDISGDYSPDGTSIAVAGTTGLRLYSAGGKLVRDLPVPGASPAEGCTPVRWWTPGTVLANCVSHLALVPVSGARPATLTPVRTQADGDFGDLDAWRLPSGLYLQSAGACGQLLINKQAASGSITPVSVPGTTSGSYQVLTAAGSRLLIRTAGCENGGQLLWLDPATRAETWLFKSGVIAAVPYPDPRNGRLS